MIYTLTLNPALDYNIFFDEINVGSVNRANDTEITFGGKGINVSCVLKDLGVYSTALGFAGGFTGTELLTRLRKANIVTDFVRLQKGLTRINVKLHTGEDTDINANGPDIDKKAIEKLYRKLDRIESGDYLCLSGSIPAGVEITYADIMARLQDKGINFVVDAEGSTLMDCLKYKPFLLKPNHKELGDMFGVKIKETDNAAEYGKKLLDMGALNVLVSMGEKGAMLVSRSGVLYADAPRSEVINTVGSGDSTVAGFLADISKGKNLEDALRSGVAAGSATAFTRGLGNGEQIAVLRQQISIRRLF